MANTSIHFTNKVALAYPCWSVPGSWFNLCLTPTAFAKREILLKRMYLKGCCLTPTVTFGKHQHTHCWDTQPHRLTQNPMSAYLSPYHQDPMLSVFPGFSLRKWHCCYVSTGEFKPITGPPSSFLDWLEMRPLLSFIPWNAVEAYCLDFFKTFLSFQIQKRGELFPIPG